MPLSSRLLVMSCCCLWKIKVKDVVAIWVVIYCIAEKKIKKKKYMSKKSLNTGKLDFLIAKILHP